jgi:hypothetical protein
MSRLFRGHGEDLSLVSHWDKGAKKIRKVAQVPELGCDQLGSEPVSCQTLENILLVLAVLDV